MGKKNKIKNSLFGIDYGNISMEDQFRVLMEADDFLNETNTSSSQTSEEDSDKIDESLIQNIMDDIRTLAYESEDGDKSFNESGEKDLQYYANKIVEDVESVPIEKEVFPEKEEQIPPSDYLSHLKITNPLPSKEVEEENADEEYIEEVEEAPKKMIPQSFIQKELENDDIEDEEDEDEEDEEEEGESELNEEDFTLDNQFKLIQGDFETGDIVIRDAWKDFKSHTISFYNMIPATMDYENSPIYNQMKSAADLAIAFISGPVLVIRQGNKKFKEFIETVRNMDKERIFILSKNENETDPNGNEIIDFLVYFIDSESKKELNLLFDTFESPEDKDNEISLDFLYAIYSKVVDRHENPWGSYSFVDSLIDEFESSDEDIDFFLDLVKKDELTELGESNFDYFMDNFVLPMESFLSDSFDEGNVFNLFEILLRIYFGKESNDSIEIKDGIIQVPTNFGVGDSSNKNTEEVTSSVENPEEEVISENEEIEIDVDEVDEEDIESITIEVAEEKETPTPSDNGIKKFGTKPYTGGSMIVRRNN